MDQEQTQQTLLPPHFWVYALAAGVVGLIVGLSLDKLRK